LPQHYLDNFRRGTNNTKYSKYVHAILSYTRITRTLAKVWNETRQVYIITVSVIFGRAYNPSSQLMSIICVKSSSLSNSFCMKQLLQLGKDNSLKT
jgi:hypothetical protein